VKATSCQWPAVERRNPPDDRAGSRAEVMNAYGEWIGGLASWNFFASLTHDPRRLVGAPGRDRQGYTRVGIQRHRRLVHDWFFEDVRRLDPSARWWSETELHKSGQPHEHGLLAVRVRAPVGDMMAAWFDRAGAFDRQPLEGVTATFSAARYVAKYTGKAAAFEPRVWGFGLLPRPSFSQVLR
jgi:hypothetical protein